jgi:hypothetical protein
MSPRLAHIAGLPVEETLPTLAPLACALVILARARLSAIRRWRRDVSRSPR